MPALRRMKFFWDFITPAYECVLKLLYGNTLRRRINNTDSVYIPFHLRRFTGTYEIDIWKKAMDEVRLGDTVADVGAFFGFYTFPFLKRVGPYGRVVAFEPDPGNLAFLKSITKRYTMGLRLEIVGFAVGQSRGKLKFDAQGISTSSVAIESNPKGQVMEVACVSLDEFFADEKLDIIKIDVEGYEEKVLAGARNILKRKSGYPRAIFIEVHPYAWNVYGTSDTALLDILADAGYKVKNVNGDTMFALKEYGAIMALRE